MFDNECDSVPPSAPASCHLWSPESLPGSRSVSPRLTKRRFPERASHRRAPGPAARRAAASGRHRTGAARAGGRETQALLPSPAAGRWPGRPGACPCKGNPPRGQPGKVLLAASGGRWERTGAAGRALPRRYGLLWWPPAVSAQQRGTRTPSSPPQLAFRSPSISDRK